MDALRKGLTEIESILTKIKTTGKQDYLSKDHDNFSRVMHDYSDVKNRLYCMERNHGGKVGIRMRILSICCFTSSIHGLLFHHPSQ